MIDAETTLLLIKGRLADLPPHLKRKVTIAKREIESLAKRHNKDIFRLAATTWIAEENIRMEAEG